jgi:hypothetical protein
MNRLRGGLSRRRFLQGAGVGGLFILGGCRHDSFQPRSEAAQPRLLEIEQATRKPEPVPASKRDDTTRAILGGHDTPNPGGSKDIQTFVSDLKALGMKTAVCIDPSPRVVEALDRAGIRLIVRLVQEHNVFDERNALWTLNKLARVPGVTVQAFNEPNIEGVAISPEEHVRRHFMSAARVILPRIAPYDGAMLLTPLAPYARFQAMDELDAYRQMLVALQDEMASEEQWMWNHLRIAVHAYAYYPGDQRIWSRVQKLSAIAEEITGRILAVEITEAGLNIDWLGQYTDEQIMAETIAMLQSPIPPSLSETVRSFCLWITANYAQRDEWHQELGTDQQELQTELDKFETAALRRLDGVTPTYLAIKHLAEQ